MTTAEKAKWTERVRGWNLQAMLREYAALIEAITIADCYDRPIAQESVEKAQIIEDEARRRDLLEKEAA